MDEGIGGFIGVGDDEFALFVDVAPFAVLLYRGETFGEGVCIVIGDGEEDFACGVDEAPFVLCIYPRSTTVMPEPPNWMCSSRQPMTLGRALR